MYAQIDGDIAIIRLKSVAGVKHGAGINIKPAHVAALACARQQSNAGGVRCVPGIGEIKAFEEPRFGKGDGQIKDDHMVFGDHAIMDHRAIFHGDGFLTDHSAACIHHHMENAILVWSGIADGVQLPRFHIKMRMRRVSPPQCAAKRIMGNRIKIGIKPNGVRASFNQRPDMACVADNVGVDRFKRAIARAGLRRLAKCCTHQRAADPTIAIPDGLAAFDAHTMHHPVASEPMV